MKVLHIYDYDGVFTDPRKGNDSPDPRAIQRLRDQITNGDPVAISTGRNFNELSRLGAIEEFERLATHYKVNIPVITEKGMAIDIIQPDGGIKSLPNTPGIVPMTEQEIAKSEKILVEILSDSKYQISKECFEIELSKKRTFFSVILTPRIGIEEKITMKDVLDLIHADMLQKDIVANFERADLHLEITGKAIDLQTNAHIKSNGSVQLMKYLGSAINGFQVISYGDSPTDVDILTPFIKEHNVLHVHVGPADKLPKTNIKVINPKGLLYADALASVAVSLTVNIKP